MEPGLPLSPRRQCADGLREQYILRHHLVLDPARLS